MSKQISINGATLSAICCVLLLLVSVGCKGDGYSLAPVTGTVSIEGEPVPELTIAFYPIGSKENPAPGPFSSAKTDSEGKFVLVSRYGKEGAVVGPHRIGFELPGDMDEEALGEAMGELEEMMSEPGADPASVKAAKDRIAKIRKKMKGFALVPPKYLKNRILEVTVPAEGLTDYAVEMKKD